MHLPRALLGVRLQNMLQLSWEWPSLPACCTCRTRLLPVAVPCLIAPLCITRCRYCSKLQQLPPGHVPLKVRLTKLAEAVAHGTKLTVVFLATAPGK